MSNLNRYLTYKALHARYENHDLLSDHIHETLPTSNLCFKVTEDLKSHLDRVSTNLSCSRREFLTQALLHALDEADEMYEMATHDLVDTGVDIK